MLAGLTLLDYAILAVYLAAVLALGVWFRRGQKTSDDFLLTGRSASWWATGLSLGVAGIAAMVYCSAPLEAYWVGAKFLLVPLLIWAALPVVFWWVIPLYSRLDLDSVYEYLELRYDPTTRTVAGGAYILFQLLWLAGLLVLACKALQLGTGLNVPVLVLLVGVGAVTVLYTVLGGMKAVIWTDILQLVLMTVTAVLLVMVAASNLDQGLPRIWQVAEKLGRATVFDPALDPAAKWSAIAAVPYLVLLPLFFFLADQATLQRFFSAADHRDLKLSFLLGCGVFSLMVPLVMYVGLGMLAVYHDKAQDEIPPYWIANVARNPESGEPLIGPETPINAETIDHLVADGAILDPNTNRPFDNTDGLVNAQGRVVIDRLATRAPGKGGGERRLRAGREQLFACFVRRHSVVGLAGLVLAALVAAAMAAVDSGLGAMATVIVIDFHRRLGWAEGWLAARCGKQPEDLDQIDELRLIRPIVPLLGAAVVLIALVLTAAGGAVAFLLGVLGIFAGPLLGIFLLGLFTRRTSALAALGGLGWGMLAGTCATFGHLVPGAWPLEKPLGPFWPLIFGLAVTLLLGYLLSFLVGPRKSRNELSGLVVGVGRLGILPDSEQADTEQLF